MTPSLVAPQASSDIVWTNELYVAPATTSPAQARDFVGQYCDRRDLHYVADDIRLVVSELVTNAVVHARTRIRVRIEELSFCVRLMVYDESLELPASGVVGGVSEEDESGRGLWIVDACSADWGVDLHDGEGKSTWALFAVRPRSSWVVSN